MQLVKLWSFGCSECNRVKLWSFGPSECNRVKLWSFGPSECNRVKLNEVLAECDRVKLYKVLAVLSVIGLMNDAFLSVSKMQDHTFFGTLIYHYIMYQRHMNVVAIVNTGLSKYGICL